MPLTEDLRLRLALQLYAALAQRGGDLVGVVDDEAEDVAALGLRRHRCRNRRVAALHDRELPVRRAAADRDEPAEIDPDLQVEVLRVEGGDVRGTVGHHGRAEGCGLHTLS
nr:hypothetical protein [Kribbella speibonae]